MLLQYLCCIQLLDNANHSRNRIFEEEIDSAIESRNEALQALRELGPPDLVHLVKQSVRSGGRQVYLGLFARRQAPIAELVV